MIDANVTQPLRVLERLIPRAQANVLYANTLLPPELNPYSRSKHTFADWGRQFAESSGGAWRFADIRLSQIYGPGDDTSKFQAWVIRSCIHNARELRLTEGNQTRDFIHVDDAAAAFLLILETMPNIGGSRFFEVGSGVGKSVRDFVETVRRLTAAETRPLYGALPYRSGEPMRLVADTSMLTALGWRSPMDLESGLTATIQEERKLCAYS